MSLEVQYWDGVADEIRAAARWYAADRPGKGRSFVLAVAEALDSVARWPNAGVNTGQVVGEATVRAEPVRGFRHHVVYVVIDDVVQVVAVAHERREPGYWADRTVS